MMTSPMNSSSQSSFRSHRKFLSAETQIRLFALAIFLLFLLVSAAKLSAQTAKPATPTRFTVMKRGAIGQPDILMIPGLSSSRDVWESEANKLGLSYRLHMVQIDGFAGAPAGANATGDILPGIVDQLHEYILAQVIHPVVIGHSLGGLLALMLADKYPADVRKLVIVDSLPFYGMMFGPTMTPEMLKPQAAQMRDSLATQKPEERKAGAEKTAEQLVLTPAQREIVVKNSLASDPHVFSEAMYEDLQTDLRADLAKIKTPTLMLYPYEPTMYGPDPAPIDALYQGAYKPMPNVKLVRIDGSRHFIQLDQPEKLDAAIQAFLK